MDMEKVQLGSPELVKVIIEQIHANSQQAIPFREYMELCLYHETLGYYRNSATKIGKAGDFYTSSSVGTAMGEMLAAYVVNQWRQLDLNDCTLSLVEWGGGNGRLALHLLDELQRLEVPCYNRTTYTMIESSEFHQGLQKNNLESHAQRLRYCTEQQWLAETIEPKTYIIVIANELLDAFPVHRLRFHNNQLQESYVAWDESTQAFIEIWKPLQDMKLQNYADTEIKEWMNDQIVEVNLAADTWIYNIANRICDGQVILIDYGDTAEELYARHRHLGTLMCYRKHQASDNPLIYQGEQDITAHVNFTACIRAGRNAGFSEHKLTTQREFLVNQGILHKLQDNYDPNPFSEAAKRNRSIRQLLVSDQMSELFKVLILTKKR
jgi:SAM-dependent MidA family methyltransferase